jgi:hypothetical protein
METEITPMLRKLIPRLASDQPGEILATVAAIGRVLRARGCDWHDLADALLAEALVKALKTRRRS